MAEALQRLRDFVWTPETEVAFFEKLANTGSVWAACRLVGCPRSTAYYRRDDDEAFAAVWGAAIKVAVARFEHHAIIRGTVGVEEPVFGTLPGDKAGSGVVGYKKRYSDALLVRVLEAHDPRYRTRHGEGMPAITVNIVNVVTDANEQARARIAAARKPAQIIDGGKAED